MKKIIYTISLVMLILTGCEEYLETPTNVDVEDVDVFGSYNLFQAYCDQMYLEVQDPIRLDLTSSGSFGGESISSTPWQTAYRSVRGDYWGQHTRGYFHDEKGIYPKAWSIIRKVNIALNNYELLLEATQEQKNLIMGQLLFFRAWAHFEVISAFGSVPYVQTVLTPADELPRFHEYNGKKDYQACTEYIVEDLTKAAELLPARWTHKADNDENRGRITKVAALGYKAKALLFAGSPLMNEYSGNSATVDVEYMKQAANAAGECLAAANGEYFLTPMSEFKTMFATTDGTHPWNDEIIWARYDAGKGRGQFTNRVGRSFVPDKTTFGGNGVNETAAPYYVDKFELADGSRYNKSYDKDTLRWNRRDPRLQATVYFDRDLGGLAPSTQLNLWKFGAGAGSTRLVPNPPLTPFVIHKYWPRGVNKVDAGWNNFRYLHSLMRLGEIYLIYAEAVNEGFGSHTASSETNSLTAMEAIDLLRARAGHVPAAQSLPHYNDFRELVLNERAVELAFEGKYWYDIRRWKQLAPTLIEDVLFDENWTPTSFSRKAVITIPWQDKHYWMPFEREQTLIYEGFSQNPGWDI